MISIIRKRDPSRPARPVASRNRVSCPGSGTPSTASRIPARDAAFVGSGSKRYREQGMNSLCRELKGRNLFRIAATYAVGAWSRVE